MDSSAEGLADSLLGELLERFAAPTPAPGGGSAAALACALSGALLQMAAGVGTAPGASAPEPVQPQAGLLEPAPGNVGEGVLQRAGQRAAELRGQALELAELELTSYAPVLQALRLAEDDPTRARRLGEARSEAAAPPLRIAAVGAELTELAAEVALRCREQLIGDVIVAASLAEGACRGAAQLVALNLAGQPGDTRHERAAELARDAHGHRERALATEVGQFGR